MVMDAKQPVVELQQQLDYERSPGGSDDGLPVKHGNSQDDADMHRLGKRQQLNVRTVAFHGPGIAHADHKRRGPSIRSRSLA